MAKEDHLYVKVTGPDFLDSTNVAVYVNGILINVQGSEGKFQCDLYDVLKLGQENTLKCKFEYGKLAEEVIYYVFRESILIETMHKIWAFRSFSLKIICDHSLVGEKIRLLEKEIKIDEAEFEEKFLANEPGEYLLKVSTKANIPEK